MRAQRGRTTGPRRACVSAGRHRSVTFTPEAGCRRRTRRPRDAIALPAIR